VSSASHDEPLITITDPAEDRYARLRLMNGYRREVLAAARVLVVGAGALGNEVLKNLALLGVGHVVIVDFDTIEASNLTRSILFRMDDRGRAKAEVAAERVRQINPDVQIIPLHGDITFDVGLGVVQRMDVVIGCLDNRAARLAVNRACWRVGTPWIDGALNVADGSVRVFIPPEGACYECLMTKQDYALANIRYACPPGTVMEGVAITTPMSASIIGAMQVQEAVKLLHGLPVQSAQGVVYSAETLRTTHITYPRRADCPAHQSFPPEDVTSLSRGVDDLTVGALLEIAAAQLGERAVLVPPDKVVTYWHCPTCDTTEKVYRPYRLVVPSEVACPACSTERIFDVAATLGSSDHTRDIPLAQVGIPPLHIVEVRTRRTRAYFELSGDQDRVLAGW
jgi:molybdopterin-synthase adenylyltransferase